MTRIVAALAVLLSALPAAAATATATSPVAAEEPWRVGPAPSDHEDLRAASVRSADGHVLYLWSLVGDEADQVFCEIHLPDGQRFGDGMPVYRIDDAAEVDTADIRDAGDARKALWAHVGRDVAFWLVTRIPTDSPWADKALEPWLTGRQIVVRYIDADGSPQATRFTLAGSSEAIQSATGIATR
jgi:hypothetical protein